MQEDIIASVYNGNDTLGLLPTGGGKSITFQVPALLKEGVCLVVTPLIALMKDQTENLGKKNIKSSMIFSGMSYREIETALDNACFDPQMKFLYLSPERLTTDLFRAKLKEMSVSMLVVDEAHCISQWGYDFRPSYLKIAEIRELLVNVPVLALTATATPEVVEDIQEKLLFRKKNVFKKTFERKNLTYYVKQTEDKHSGLLKIIKHYDGSGIVYARNRRKTAEISKFLNINGIQSDFYHAGLDVETRNNKQELWKTNKCRVMVSTNAFGMGIDKPDVRFVIHIDLPDSLEAYFQEAGRAGRDEKPSVAVLLVDETDRMQIARQLDISFPEITKIREVYHALGNYLEIPYGSGKNTEHEFSLTGFTNRYKFDILTAFNSLKILEDDGYLTLSEEIDSPSRIHIIPRNNELYEFQVMHSNYDPVIKLLLRTYPGLFSEYVRIDEEFLSKRAGIGKDRLVSLLLELQKLNVIDYIPYRRSPVIFFQENRIESRDILLSKQNYRDKKERKKKRIELVINYAYSNNKCRNQLLLMYFGEKSPSRCGICDVCRQRNELGLSNYEFDSILSVIKGTLTKEPVELAGLIGISPWPKEKTLKVINWLLDHGKITYNKQNRLKWSKRLKQK